MAAEIEDKPDEDVILSVLREIEGDSAVTQRSLASRLGVALGLTNAYLKRCVRKGWVKVHEIPPRRYAYYLTPRGFAEKSRLTGEYLSDSFGFFRRAREECSQGLERCARAGWRRVALFGDGELAEVAIIAAREIPVEVVAVIAPGSNKETAAGLPVAQAVDGVDSYDAVLLTDIKAPQASFEYLRERFAEHRIIVPPILGVTRKGDGAGRMESS